MYFANNSIFVVVALMLYVFDISKVQDKYGEEIEPDAQYDGFISCVISFGHMIMFL